MSKYIEFDEVMPAPGGVWVIRNKKTDSIIGYIEWYDRWRQYVTKFNNDSVWSHECLTDISKFLRTQNAMDMEEEQV